MKTAPALRLAFGCAAALFASASFAQDAGYYLGGMIATSKQEVGCNFVSGGQDCKVDTTFVKPVAGYQFNRYLGVEGAYSRRFVHVHSVGAAALSIETRSWEVDAVARYPFGRLAPFAKAGVYRASMQQQVTAGANGEAQRTDLTFGLGVELGITQSILTRFEWQRYPHVGGSGVTSSNVNVLAAGAFYRF